jgi:hypothetical protein
MASGIQIPQAAYSKTKRNQNKFKKNIINKNLKSDFMQLFNADATMFFFFFFSHENIKKNRAQKLLIIQFFPLLPLASHMAKN